MITLALLASLLNPATVKPAPKPAVVKVAKVSDAQFRAALALIRNIPIVVE